MATEGISKSIIIFILYKACLSSDWTLHKAQSKILTVDVWMTSNRNYISDGGCLLAPLQGTIL